MSTAEMNSLAKKAIGNAEEGFSPLTDNGDAFRLACDLQIQMNPGLDRCVASYWQRPEMILLWEHGQLTNEDICFAMRQAIVDAAAAIGKAMP